ncbi:MAG: GNAT family N-acetyltransferase [Synergistaceae bacterium]|nr:GNAT family N-acetyltransferase [Synergistaceae bacterium]
MSPNAVWENLAFFLTRLRRLPCCSSLVLGGGRGFCVSTRSAFASENWAFFPAPLTDAEPVEAAVDFFKRCGLPFIWPLFGEGAEASSAFLKRAGLREGGRLLAMSLPLPDNATRHEAEGVSVERVSFHLAKSRDDALRWAEAAWLGFDGEGTAPAEFRELAIAMSQDPALRLATARVGKVDAGVSLLSLSEGSAGVYYFATLPRYRRRGVATLMMEEAGRMAVREGKSRIILQATPAGVPFYRSFGFEGLFEIPLFSTTDDVF